MKDDSLVVRESDPVPPDREAFRLIGGKALGLHRLRGMGINVPPWATLTTHLFRHVCSRDEELSRLGSGTDQDDTARATRMRSRIEEMPIESSITDRLLEVWQGLSEGGDLPLAVRSSAADEDSEMLSFAGQMDSFLNVRGRDEFLRAVRMCWASLFGDRAVLYRRSHGIDPWSAEIAVVVQRMVRADVSGVLFTANPLTGRRQEMLVSSTWGLGEGLVAGILEADTFVLDPDGSVLSRDIAEKRHTIVYGAEGGTERRELDGARREVASLSDTQLGALHDLGLKVQEARGMPMDIEFSVAGNAIYLLQARPITTLGEARAMGENRIVWDNSNIVESYAGVTTPLTFSFIRSAYHSVYVQFCEVIGVSRKTIFRNRYLFDNMLGLIKGRVYYNLLNWYRLVSLMPGFDYNKKFMEQMMGLQVIPEVSPEDGAGGGLRKYLFELPRLLRVGLKMVLAHLTLERRIADFQTQFAKTYARYSALHFDRMSPAELRQVYRELEEEVLWKWKAPILNDFEAMIFYGLLRNITSSWGLDDAGTLHNDLLCGEGGIRSTAVTTELTAIAQMIEGRERLKGRFVEATPGDALMLLRTDPEAAGIEAELSRYLRDFGVRSIDEMKLESVPIRDDPKFCISVIQSYLRTSLPDIAAQKRRERDIRMDAERTVARRLKARGMLAYPLRRLLYRWVVNNTRRAVKNRENQRFCRAEAYSLVRDIMRAIGRNWAGRGLLDGPEDIFYLTMDEVWSFIGGTATTVRLRDIAFLRKQEFEGYRKETTDDHMETLGEVYTSKALSEGEAIQVPEEGGLRGLGCCQGIVQGEVKVVLRPEAGMVLKGEIMVARQTDPGWVVLFPSISGLIVEKGSMLSHSAIVAREMGIPAVVGVKNATRILRTGDTVWLDGARGVIKIVKRAGD